MTYSTQGTHVITWIFDDGNGNSINVNQNVIIDDLTAPVPNVATLPAATGECSVTVVAPTATDNCSGNITGTTISPLTYSSQGTYTIVWTYNDGNGNISTQNQTVIVDDVTAPTATCQNLSITLDATGSASITAAEIDNGSTDNCGIQTMFLDKTDFNCSDLGANTVTLTVRDFSGNESTCTATVTVVDPAESASVSIVSNDANNEICIGENLTFTATPTNGGTEQYYQWFINGVSEGTTTSPTFTPTTAPTGDYNIIVQMTTDISACDPKVSNTLSITVHPLPTVSVSSSVICSDDNTQTASPSTGGSWISNNTGVATIDNNGAITPVGPGTVTFTYTNTATGCSNTTTSVTINPPLVVNAPATICVNETTTLSPASGGTWISNATGIATINPSTGEITGVSAGNVSFTFTDASGCTATTSSVEVLAIPVITSVISSPNTVCAGDPSILTANAQGAGGNNQVLINYDFNTGSNYNSLDGKEAPGINSTISNGDNMPFLTGGGTATGVNAYTNNNIAGSALRQQDDRDGWFSGDDEGYWIFDIAGASLNTYQDFSIYFQTRRTNSNGSRKYIHLYYRINNTGNYVHFYTELINNNNQATQWKEVTSPIPDLANNPNRLQIAVQVTDGYNRNNNRPDILIDNFQVQATTVGETFLYSWTSNTSPNDGLPPGAEIPSSTNNTITVRPETTTQYTVSVTNGEGCQETETVVVNVFPSPEIIINANYCPEDLPGTPQNESNMVQLVASSSVPITNWTWLTTPEQTGNTIYVDIAGTYQVIGVTANGCSESVIFNVAQELVVNGDFSAGNTGFTSDYTYHEDLKTPQEWVPQYEGGDWWNGYYYFGGELYDDSGTNGYSIVTNANHVHSNFWGYDHTNNTTGDRNFMAVNGHGNTLVVWKQQVTVEPNTQYYFSAWGMSLNNSSETGQLTFNVDGTNVGTQPSLPRRAENSNPASDNWTRFYGNWISPDGPGPMTIDIEIRNLNPALGGNDFGIDDISFGTLSTFIRMTSPPGADAQVICQNTTIDEIAYDIGGGLTAPSIEWSLNGSTSLGIDVFPDGLSYTFNGLSYVISGTPSVSGNYTYEVKTTSACDVKSAVGSLTINPEAVVSITTPDTVVCQSQNSIPLSTTLSGSATGGTWTTNGSGTFTPSVTDPNATYNFGSSEIGDITLTFTSNNPDGPCEATVETLDIEITPYFVASAGPNLSTADCDTNTVTLDANDVTGQWTASPNSGYFSDPTAYNSTFTGESGETYTLTWTATNTGVCTDNTTATMTVTIPDCGTNLVFEGDNEYISFGDHYDLDGSFSIEAWIKPANLTGTKTIISKRNGTALTNGYDLSLVENNLRFRFNGSGIAANQNITSNRWHHVAVTYNGTSYRMFIDGFVVRTSTAGAAPITNSNKALIGAMDNTDNSPTHYFNGVIDEVRIWNKALSETQIREMMNQEIEANGTNVSGVVIPQDIAGLQWTDLSGYYQMNTGPQTSFVSGSIQDISSTPVPGRLNGMTDNQLESAPIPYRSSGNSDWDSAITWSATSDQQVPNTRAGNIVPGLAQTWNIVRTESNVTANRPAGYPTTANPNQTTVLGLHVVSDQLNIGNSTSHQPLYVNKYLRLDGTLKLVGESQLIQPEGSIVDAGSGDLQRDQQGSGSLFNYNYWGSPVNVDGATYNLNDILFKSTDPNNLQTITWTSGINANNATNTMSSRWIYEYSEGLDGDHSAWFHKGATGSFNLGLGFTMKGSGAGNGSSMQNYTFVGQPNNGTITNTVTASAGTQNQTLVGNPYPSAIDAREFINDNIPGSTGSTESIDGSLTFWRQSTTNNSHYLRDYEGGYASLNLSGGTAATAFPGDIISGIGDAGNLTPGYFIPVAQGFFVTAADDQVTSNVVFRNSQRAFRKESPGQSIFLRGSENQKRATDSTGYESDDMIQRVRLAFKTPETAIRPLLLAFTPNNDATDGFDYGYDALNRDDFPSDMSFLIEGKKYIIQGVGAFDINKKYPLDMTLGITGNVEIALTDLENFDEAIDVYVHDGLLDTYTRINTVSFQTNLEAGNYNGRFSIVFQPDTTLSTIDQDFKDISVKYLQKTDEIYVKTPASIEVRQLYLINMAGQAVRSWNMTNMNFGQEFKIPVKDISEGNYILQVETNTNSYQKKIIIKF
ncbi:LamG-like jellyroll fold domain-containing protein [Gelidibacter pelagius]|uniref:T9SS type A sorting domain-containing protein n=1 Tax=Gelidibacter pelagius TaxID=2819985 RepID=A0ABS3SX14_9FLAO|nr:LamG-like jellyroll fold domain-containing protein [Gelidibacter pelagius]MBO3100275.1 T9SS type A sorting domain-containing protein [Gelidibacter pelagius]